MLKREVALAALTMFAGFTAFTELRIVRILYRKTDGQVVKQSLLNCKTSLLMKKMSKFV